MPRLCIDCHRPLTIGKTIFTPSVYMGEDIYEVKIHVKCHRCEEYDEICENIKKLEARRDVLGKRKKLRASTVFES